MESPARRSLSRRHKMPEAASGRRIRRSDSNISSTSSDIQVASGSQPPRDNTTTPVQSTTSHPGLRRRHVTAVVKRRVLVIRNLKAHQFPAGDTASLNAHVNNVNDMAPPAMPIDDEEGPNHRGTYSKAYTLRHPEFTWIHRGQGRYLPSASVRTPGLKTERSAASPASFGTPSGRATTSLHQREPFGIGKGSAQRSMSRDPRGSMRGRPADATADAIYSGSQHLSKPTDGPSNFNQQVALHGDDVFDDGDADATGRTHSNQDPNLASRDTSQMLGTLEDSASQRRALYAMGGDAAVSWTDQPDHMRFKTTDSDAAGTSTKLQAADGSLAPQSGLKRKVASISDPASSERPSRRQRIDTDSAGVAEEGFVDDRSLVRAKELTADERYHLPRRQACDTATPEDNDHEGESEEWQGFSDNEEEHSEAGSDINNDKVAREGSARTGARRTGVADEATGQAFTSVDIETHATTPDRQQTAGRAAGVSDKVEGEGVERTDPLQQTPKLRQRLSRSSNTDGHAEIDEEAIDDEENDIGSNDNMNAGDELFPAGSEGVSTDPNGVRTYSREVVDVILHHYPNQEFYHTGNSWWKRGRRPRAKKGAGRGTNEYGGGDDDRTPSAPTAATPALRTRAQQTPANPPAFTTPATAPAASTSLDPHTLTYKKKDIQRLYPGEEYHHVGNGWYRRGAGPGRRASQALSQALPEPELDARGTVDKETTLQYPHIEWQHRGNGRYRRKDQLEAPASLAATVPRRSRASMVEDEDEDSLFIPETNPSDRLRRRRKSTGFAVDDDDDDDEEEEEEEEQEADEEMDYHDDAEQNDQSQPHQLFFKDYVDAHPNIEFHHRGQGRYALGPRPKRSIAPPAAPTPPPVQPEPAVDPNQKFTTSYVDKHPDITFHHKGQGRWVMGMPDRNAPNYNKIAIRGPGAAFRDSRQAEEPAATKEVEEDSDNEMIGNFLDSTTAVPGATTLMVKAQIEQWPQFTWHYIGGGKWSRMEKKEYDRLKAAKNAKETADRNAQLGRGSAKRKRRGEIEGAEAQLERETEEAERNTAEFANGTQSPPVRKSKVQKTSRVHLRGGESMPQFEAPSKTSTPKPQMLEPEQDIVLSHKLTSYYGDTWDPVLSGDHLDAADRYLRANYSPTTGFAPIVASLEKFDPAVRSTGNLYTLAKHTQAQLQAMQDEYLQLDKIVAPHSKVPRKPAKGGRLPVDSEMYEDQKEAVLYDYEFDKRKIGYQDPDAQKTLRDADGRELRKRRVRGPAGELLNGIDGADVVAVQQTGMFGQPEKITGKRAVRPVSRFDGVVADSGRKRKSGTGNGNSGASTPVPVAAAVPSGNGSSVAVLPVARKDAAQPQPVVYGDYVAPTKGRWAGHVPKAVVKANKRVEELKRQSGTPSGLASSGGGANTDTTTATGESTHAAAGTNGLSTPTPATGQRSVTPGGSQVRKGRPPGSKNLHKRKDAGIPKGPRKPKKTEGEGGANEGASGGLENGGGSQGQGAEVVNTIES
ncbi:hypothetical protein MBLNU230_g3467t1 [Neophaeotheca triangularis]